MRRRLAVAATLVATALGLSPASPQPVAVLGGDAFALAPGPGGRGATAARDIAPLEVIATIPRALALVVDRSAATWPGDLAAAALAARADGRGALGAGARSWAGGGWATDSGDLDPRDGKLGSLVATGSDNDFEIYKKFGLTCHPAVDRAAERLARLCGAGADAARAAIGDRNAAFRLCRDRLSPLVTNPTRTAGTPRSRRELEAAEVFSLALARVAALGDASAVVAPLFGDLADGGANANARLATSAGGGDDALLVVATRAIASGAPLTRDYGTAPSVGRPDGARAAAAAADEALRRYLHFGIPPP